MANQTTYSSNATIGFSGMQAVPDRNAYLTLKNAEASVSIPFGVAVKLKTSSPASDLDALLPAANSDTIIGITAFSQTYDRAWIDADGVTHGDLDATGLRKGSLMQVATTGRLLVTCPSGCAPGDRLYVRADIGEGTEALGTLENASDESDMIDCTQAGLWLTTAVAGGLAWLQFDFTGKMT